MKLSQIPQFTSQGSYTVDHSLRYLDEYITELVTKEGLQLNPDFQRGHVWTESQQISYIEYLLRGGRAARTIYLNHPGWMSTFEGEFVCVDGLQRLTACLRFLRNEIKVFGYYLNEYEDRLPTTLIITININNLQTRKEVLQWYLDMNTGGTVHTDEEITKVKKMIENL